MNTQLRTRLVFHAALVTTLGMLSGIPLAMSILEYLSSNPEDWKLSHMEGLTNGLLMFAVAGTGHLLLLSSKQQLWLFYSLVFIGYSNALYGWVRGFSGQQGMDFAAPLSNQITALLGGLPIATAFIAIALIAIGACKKSKPNNKTAGINCQLFCFQLHYWPPNTTASTIKPQQSLGPLPRLSKGL